MSRFHQRIHQSGQLWSWEVAAPFTHDPDDAARVVIARGVAHSEDRARRRAATATQKATTARDRWLRTNGQAAS